MTFGQPFPEETLGVADESTEFLWPGRHVSLFGGSLVPTFEGSNACFQLQPSWSAYKSAYEEAVKLIVPAASRGNDFLIYPLIFCARHAVELGLKEAHRLLTFLEKHEATYPPGHKLAQLWREVAKLQIEAGLARRMTPKATSSVS